MVEATGALSKAGQEQDIKTDVATLQEISDFNNGDMEWLTSEKPIVLRPNLAWKSKFPKGNSKAGLTVNKLERAARISFGHGEPITSLASITHYQKREIDGTKQITFENPKQVLTIYDSGESKLLNKPS